MEPLDTLPALPTDRPPTQAERREAFCRHYVVYGNAATAYLHAYDCKPESAAANAGRLLKREDVKRRIAELETERREILRRRVADIEAALAALLTADGTSLIDADDALEALRQLPADVRQWVSVSIEVTIGADGQPARKIKASIPNKLDAMKFLAQLRGQLVNRTDVTSGGRSLAQPIDLDSLASEALERAKQRLGIADVVDAEVVEPAERGRPKLEELV